MQKILKVVVITLFYSCFILKIDAGPASPYPFVYTQPDGTKITIILKGDEHIKLAITSDGYTLILNNQGFYEYAMKNSDDDLILSGISAKDPNNRVKDENDFLANLKKGLGYSNKQIGLVMGKISQSSMKSAMSQNVVPKTGNLRLLCILIGFTDKSFTKTKTDFNNLFNQVGYSADGAAGSVKDYYLEDSYQQLNLTIDVVGPYTASGNMQYYGGNDALGEDLRPGELIAEAINLANADVNYADYDNDNNGAVDAVYVIFAGYGEDGGGPSYTIWPHAWSLSPVINLDGKTIARYSCSSELRWSTGENITRIGVICHEIGHILGASDFYDTDFSDSGGEFDGTGEWDLMAAGEWNNGGATPAHNNAYTKTTIFNWANSTTLNSGSTITLYNSEEFSNSFYRFNTVVTNEYFILENRAKLGFDASLPGEGLIIYHVHKDIGMYDNNITHPQKLYIVCAGAASDPGISPVSYGNINSASCPFPGLLDKTSFTDITLPSSKAWNGSNTGKPITDISYNVQDKTVTFDFMRSGVYADFISNKDTAVINDTIIFTDASAGNTFTTWEWNFGKGAVPSLASGQGPHNVIYTNPGLKTISLNVDNTYSTSKENYITINPLSGSELKIYTDNENISLFPVPAKDKLNIELKGFSGKAVIEIVDLSGNTIYRKAIPDINSFYNQEIILNNAVSGIYFFRLNSLEKANICMFIINN